MEQHPRTAIREALIAKIRAALPAKLPVYSTRPGEISKDDAPSVLVYYTHETSDTVEGNDNFPKAYERSMHVNIDIVVVGSGESERDLDRYGILIERAIFINSTMGGICYGVRLTTTTVSQVSPDGDANLYFQRQTWIIKYRVETSDLVRADEFLEFSANMTKDDDITDVILPSENVIRTK